MNTPASWVLWMPTVGCACATLCAQDVTGLTGHWAGARERLEARGLHPFLNYTLDGTRVLKGGYERGAAIAGVADFGVDLDFSKLSGGAGRLHAEGFYFHGDDPTAELVGDFNYFDNIVAAGGLRLYQLAYSFGGDGWETKLGLTAVDEDFATNQASTVFVNSAFGALPTMVWNSSVPIWPVNGLGVLVRKNWRDGGFAQVGLYDGEAEPDGDHHRGTRVRLGSEQGALLVAETGLEWTEQERHGRFTVGAWLHTGKFETLATGERVRSNHSLHALAEQSLDARGHWTGFARFGYAPKTDRSLVKTHADCGVHGNGAAWGRSDDVVGLAYFRTTFSGDYLGARGAQGSRVSEREEGVEFTYSLAVARGLWLQPDVQQIFGAHEINGDVTIAMVRLYAEF
jgi:porin